MTAHKTSQRLLGTVPGAQLSAARRRVAADVTGPHLRDIAVFVDIGAGITGGYRQCEKTLAEFGDSNMGS